MEKITQIALKQGQEFSFKTPETEDDIRIADVSYSEHLSKFCIWFNGKLYTYKHLSSMKTKLNGLIVKWKLK